MWKLGAEALVILVSSVASSQALTSMELKPVHVVLELLPSNDNVPQRDAQGELETNGSSLAGSRASNSDWPVEGVIFTEVITAHSTPGFFVAIEKLPGVAIEDGGDGIATWYPIAVLTNMEGLKHFVKGLPPGSTVDWSASCFPIIDEHPLSAAGAIRELERYAAQCGVEFNYHGSG